MELFDQPQNNQCVTIIVFRALSITKIAEHNATGLLAGSGYDGTAPDNGAVVPPASVFLNRKHDRLSSEGMFKAVAVCTEIVHRYAAQEIGSDRVNPLRRSRNSYAALRLTA